MLENRSSLVSDDNASDYGEVASSTDDDYERSGASDANSEFEHSTSERRKTTARRSDRVSKQRIINVDGHQVRCSMLGFQSKQFRLQIHRSMSHCVL